MATVVCKTKRTKDDLLEEMCELKKELANLERYKKYEESAGECAALMTAFKESGFTDDQAFELVKQFIISSAAHINR